MDPQEQAHKLDMIRTLTAGELVGWHRYCTAWRQPFAGEIVALMERAKVLGIELPSSDAAPSASTTTIQRVPQHMLIGT